MKNKAGLLIAGQLPGSLLIPLILNPVFAFKFLFTRYGSNVTAV